MATIYMNTKYTRDWYNARRRYTATEIRHTKARLEEQTWSQQQLRHDENQGLPRNHVIYGLWFSANERMQKESIALAVARASNHLAAREYDEARESYDRARRHRQQQRHSTETRSEEDYDRQRREQEARQRHEEEARQRRDEEARQRRNEEATQRSEQEAGQRREEEARQRREEEARQCRDQEYNRQREQREGARPTNTGKTAQQWFQELDIAFENYATMRSFPTPPTTACINPACQNTIRSA